MTTISAASHPSLPLPSRAAYDGSALLAVTAAMLALAMVPTALAGLLDQRLFNGINIWIKPLKFQASLVLHLVTIAWALLALPEQMRRTRTVSILAWALVAAAMFEGGYITWQASRGAGSHYNLTSPWSAAMYRLMGVGAATLVVAAAWIGALILRHGDRRNVVIWGTGIGLLLGGVLGGITGGFMSAQPGHWVGTAPTDAGGLWVFGWSRSGGDLRVAHFFGLHLMQALPAVAFLAARFTPRASRQVLYAAAAAGTVLTIATFTQALAGRPLIPN
ncbi:MAG: hypothetical protein ING23_19360 [Roseomonas sp.]|jgi:hypothetical protein|nr:hypothetical protein [Burkholderiales bacterium]MCA3292576.1 hypothetical protein [Roseomonas sp.]MCA3296304.1 hypothetical protein [Roseomonas sp.]